MRKLLVICSFISVLAMGITYGQKAPSQPLLPDFDTRKNEFSKWPFTAPDQKAALGQLTNLAAQPQIQANRLLGTPLTIRARLGLLSDPAAAALGGTADADPAVYGFLDKYSALFGQNSTLLTSAVVVKQNSVSAGGGLRTKIWEQQVNGVPVFEGTLTAHTTRHGELVRITSRMVPNLQQVADAAVPNHPALVAAPPISATEAVVRAAENIFLQLTAEQVTAQGQQNGWLKFAAPGLTREAYARLTWLPTGRVSLRLCWEVLVCSQARAQAYRVLVDAQTGGLLLRRGLTRYISDATYRVYTGDSPTPFTPACPTPCSTQPPEVARELLILSAIDTNASPNGWIDDGVNETLGNNVDASTDLDGDLVPDLPRPQGSPSRVFDFELALTNAPSAYSSAAVVHLFYRCNWAHDVLYDLGFDEASGNFQTDNFGRGGLENDALLANAQTSLMTDNAFFFGMPDGIASSLNMGIFTGTSPDRDSSLDSEVALHEYGHGVSDRLDGGIGYIAQSGGLQEGWSDFLALSLLSESGDDVDGTYPTGGYLTYQIIPGFTQNYYFGIRRYPYSTDMTKNPLTYKDIDPAQADSHSGVPISPIGWEDNGADEVHNAGEVWCSALWEVRAALINQYGFDEGNDRALKLVLAGMKLLNGQLYPSYLDARDAILDADIAEYSNEDYALLWRAFAKRGLGFSAQSPSGFTTDGLVEAFDGPGLVFDRAIVTGGNGNESLDANECANLQVVLSNLASTNFQGGITASLKSLTPGVLVVEGLSAFPAVPVGGTTTNDPVFQVSVGPSFPCGSSITFELTIKRIEVGATTLTFDLPTNPGTPAAPTAYDNTTALDLPDLVDTTSSIIVSNFTGTVGTVTVSLFLEHTWDADLSLTLIGPDGTEVVLADGQGGAGDNFGSDCGGGSRTVFDDDAAVSIAETNAPFVGTFRPQGTFADFNGQDANGEWQLRIVDSQPFDFGTLQCWTLNIATTACEDGGGVCVSVPQLCVVPASVNFGSVAVGNVSTASRFTLGSCGSSNLTITGVSIIGEDAASFAVTSPSCAGSVLAVGEECAVDVVFAPPTAGTAEAFLEITCDDPGSPYQLSLTGNGETCSDMWFTPAALSSIGLGVLTTNQLSVVGGTAPITFIRTAGAPPTGVTLSSTGLLTGTPAATGSYSFKVRATDALGCVVEKWYTWQVTCPTLIVQPNALPLGEADTAYTVTLTASGGVSPYTFSQTVGSLPEGLTLSTNGVISGTLTGTGSSFTVTVTDANGCSANVIYTIQVAQAPPSLPVSAFGPALLEVAYSQSANVSGGVAPYHFALTGGTLPTGLKLSTSGELAGVPTTLGQHTFTVTVTDVDNRSSSRDYTVTVVCPTITGSPAALPDGTTGSAYSGAISAAGGHGPYTYALASGTLPSGLSLSTAGLLSGTPTAAGEYGFAVAATDANSCAGQRSYTVTVNAAGGSGGGEIPTTGTAQFAATSLMACVTEGSVQLAVTRTGAVDQPATVRYATLGGTAGEGVDFVGGSGLLSFAAGETVQTLSVPILASKNSRNRSFGVRLISPAGVSLGAPSEIIVTLTRKLAFVDADGDLVTVQLSGRGSLAVSLLGANTGPVGQIQIWGTDARSRLTVKVKRRKGADGLVSVGNITCTGDLKDISAPVVVLPASEIHVAGTLGSYRTH